VSRSVTIRRGEGQAEGYASPARVGVMGYLDMIPTDRKEGQREFWRSRYAEDPSFFGEEESAFARWCAPKLQAEEGIREVIELGSGYGRDARYLSAQGFHVRGVDLATPRPSGTRELSQPERPSELLEGDAFEFLRQLAPQGADAVYSNIFFNMDFTEEEHQELMEAIYRVLRKGGLHLYSARSTSDPWYGRGKRVGPDTFDPAPHGVTMHYFSAEYASRLSEGRFDPVEQVERSEGEGEFPIRLLYVVDRRR
jgi:SAM-dependent methyltransferase